MCCMCQIVPERVLKRLAADRKYSAEQRKNFADTIKIDTQLRRLRTQAARLTRVAALMAEAPTVAPRRPSPCTIAIMVKPCPGLKFLIRRRQRIQPQDTFFRKRNRLKHSMRRSSDEIQSMTRE